MPEDYKQMKIKIASSKSQRARKSFPTPKLLTSGSLQIVPVPSTLPEKHPPPTPANPQSQSNPPALNMFQNKKTINNMVYIPIDNNLNRPLDPNEFLRVSSSMPIPPLVTVSNNPVVFTPSNTIPQNSQQSSTTATLVSSSQSNNSTTQTSTVSSTTSSLTTSSLQNSNHHMMSGFVTPNLASAITNTIARGPPKLIPKPTGPLRSDGETHFTPEAGPLSRKLVDNAHKVYIYYLILIESF